MTSNRLALIAAIVMAAVLAAAYVGIDGRLLSADQMEGWWLGSAFGVMTALRLGRAAEPTSERRQLARQLISMVWLGTAWAGMLLVLSLALSIVFDGDRAITAWQLSSGTVSILVAAGWWFSLKRFGLAARTRVDAASDARLAEVRRKAREDVATYIADLDGTRDTD